MKDIMIATSNVNKVKEYKTLLEPLGYKVHSLDEIEKIDIDENGTTFQQNAFIKANAVYSKTNMITIADDSGLMIKAFNNAPGIHSARFMEGFSYRDKQNTILQLMEFITDREAKFVCAICLIDELGVHNFTGELFGEISKEIVGDGGFGYDPIFYYPQYQRTGGQLTVQEKNAVSHRGVATRKLLEYLRGKN